MLIVLLQQRCQKAVSQTWPEPIYPGTLPALYSNGEKFKRISDSSISYSFLLFYLCFYLFIFFFLLCIGALWIFCIHARLLLWNDPKAAAKNCTRTGGMMK